MIPKDWRRRRFRKRIRLEKGMAFTHEELRRIRDEMPKDIDPDIKREILRGVPQ